MPPVKNVGKPCAGEPHARFDGRELETGRTGHGHGEERPDGKPWSLNRFMTYRQNTPPRQLPTLLGRDLAGVAVTDMARSPPDPRPLCRHQMIKRWPWVTA